MLSNLAGHQKLITGSYFSWPRSAQQAADSGRVDLKFASLALGYNLGITGYDFD